MFEEGSWTETVTEGHKVEAVLNSRPISYCASDSPEDEMPISPIQFLSPNGKTGFPQILRSEQEIDPSFQQTSSEQLSAKG